MQKVGKRPRKQQIISKYGNSWSEKPYDSGSILSEPINRELKRNERKNEKGIIHKGKASYLIIGRRESEKIDYRSSHTWRSSNANQG